MKNLLVLSKLKQFAESKIWCIPAFRCGLEASTNGYSPTTIQIAVIERTIARGLLGQMHV